MNKYLKLTASFLSLILLFSLCGCGDERQTASKSKKIRLQILVPHRKAAGWILPLTRRYLPHRVHSR